jgi:hypothetical protein
MYIHNFLTCAQEDVNIFYVIKKKILDLTPWGQNKEKPFFYNIAGSNYTLDEIKHGMLRYNQNKPGSWSPTLNATDPKCQHL